MWPGTKGQKMIKPKSKGSEIMVSNFVDEFHTHFLPQVTVSTKQQSSPIQELRNTLGNSLKLERVGRAT